MCGTAPPDFVCEYSIMSSNFKYVVKVNNEFYEDRVPLNQLELPNIISENSENINALDHKIMNRSDMFLSFRFFLKIRDGDLISQIQNNVPYTYQQLLDDTKNFLIIWDGDSTQIFDTIEATETAILEQYKSMLTAKNINDVTISNKIIDTFKNTIGIVNDTTEEYKNRIESGVSQTNINYDDVFNSFSDLIPNDDVFYMRIIVHHTWGYVSTHIKGNDEHNRTMFAFALCYERCFNKIIDEYTYSTYEKNRLRYYYLNSIFETYMKTHVPNKFNSNEKYNLKQYLIGFFTEESTKYPSTFASFASTIDLNAKRMAYVNQLLETYDNIISNQTYNRWKKIFINSISTSNVDIRFLRTISTKQRYLFQQIYAIEQLYKLITRGAIISAMSRVGSTLKSTFNRPAQPASAATQPTSAAVQPTSAATSRFSSMFGSKKVGGRRTHRNRRRIRSRSSNRHRKRTMRRRSSTTRKRRT
jgi:hypothetical protein